MLRFLLADHLHPTFGANLVNAALPNQVRDLLAALGADAVATGAGAGLVAAAAATSTFALPAFAFSKSVLGHLFEHRFTSSV